jgi:hypothetical protein
MLLFHHSCHGLVEGEVGGKRKDVWPRHHNFAHGDIGQFQRMGDDLLFKRGKQAKAAAGRDNQLQLVGRMGGAGSYLARAEDP